MFWALVLEAGKHYSQDVEDAFHISMASLEIPTDQEVLKARRHENVSVMVGAKKSEFLVCTLNYKSLTQQQLDLNFTEGEEVTFFVTGSGTVHLTGYNLESEPDMEMDDGEESDEGESSDEELVLEAGKKRKNSQENKETKRMKWLTPGGGEFIDDEDEDDDFADGSGLIEMEAEEGEEDDDSDDSEEAFNTESQLKKKDLVQTPKSKAGHPTPKAEKGSATTSKAGHPTPKAEKDAAATPKPKTQNVGLGKLSGEGEAKSSLKQKQGDTPVSSVGASGDASSTDLQSEKKKRKKKKKKKSMSEEDQQKLQSLQTSKSPQQEIKILQETKTPQSAKSAQELKTPQQNTKDNTPKEKPQQVKTPKKQVLQGGIISEEIHIGDGPMVKPGQMVHVYYIGKLQASGNQFDSCMKGKPYSFKLGQGQVIKGWDIGVQGMKVGGKRRLTIPPNQGYGNERSGPIPPNSTLVFEVELKNIS